jgi:rubrerythrin
MNGIQKIEKGRNTVSFKNLKDIIEYAIENEKEAEAFYLSISEEAVNSAIKETFLSFAGEERKHQKTLENLLSGEVDENIESYTLKWIPDIKRSNYVVDMTYEKGMNYRDILLLAMKREEKALGLYNDLQERCESEGQKRVFMILSQEEAKHKLALETEYDDMMAEMGD